MESNDDTSSRNRSYSVGGREGGEGEHEVVPYVRVSGFRGAVKALEHVDDRRPIKLLSVSDIRGIRQGQLFRAGRGDDAPFFPRFVSLLGMREGGRPVRHLCLSMDCRGLPDEDTEKFFRDVLPSHPTLQGIRIDLTGIPPRCLQILTQSVPTNRGTALSRLSRLSFSSVTGPEKVQAIVDMLKRNAAIESLRVDFRSGPDRCNLILQALARNTNLRSLDIYSLVVKEIFPDALVGVAASSLRSLTFSGRLSEDAVSSLARQLRNNETLETLRLIGGGRRDSRDPRALVDLVKTYNCTLRLAGDLHIHDARAREQLEEYTRRNVRIRHALKQLKDPEPELRLVVSTRLLPNLLGLMSDLPTQLYRILKLGYVNTVGDLLARPSDGTDVGTTSIEASEPSPGRTAKRQRMDPQGDDEEMSTLSVMFCPIVFEDASAIALQFLET